MMTARIFYLVLISFSAPRPPPCYAWALMTNHVHMLLRTGMVPLATLMRRLMTGYAGAFNLRHRRHGPLFQSWYKSILCQEDVCLLELTRYIHLNPLRAGIVEDLSALDRYPYTGHAVLMGKHEAPWQDTGKILGLFYEKTVTARSMYRKFADIVTGKIFESRSSQEFTLLLGGQGIGH